MGKKERNQRKISLEKSQSDLPWIEQKISQLECAKFVSSKRFTRKCGCGRLLDDHDAQVQIDELQRQSTKLNVESPLANESDDMDHKKSTVIDRWQVKSHTKQMPTNSYGTVEFHAGPHPTRAKYVRINYDTKPEYVVHLLLREWKLRVPSLVISTIGGLANCCPLQTKLLKVVQSGILRAAKTTGAWVITNGLDTGVTKHIGEALKDEIHVRGSNIVALGIAPWGVVQNREQLVGLDHTCSYHWQETRQQQEIPLNPDHNYFLLTDNGTSGKFGSEFFLRRKLEQYLAQQPIDWRRFGAPKSRVPVIAVLIEGGSQTFRTVFELVTGRNPVPIVVCDGSGRAADLLAFMHRFCNEDGELSPPLKEQIISNLCRTFQIQRSEAETLCLEMKFCMKRRDLISVFRMGEGASDEIDIAILTALLQASGQNLTLAEQLSLTMAWNRSDIARSKVFANSIEWPINTLESAMADALLNDRLEFVQLILEKGLSMKKFLTVSRLEELYNIAYSSSNRSFYRLFIKLVGARPQITLRLVGQLIEQLIGGGYQHPYCMKIPSLSQQTANVKSASFSSDINTYTPYIHLPNQSHSIQTNTFPNNPRGSSSTLPQHGIMKGRYSNAYLNNSSSTNTFHQNNNSQSNSLYRSIYRASQATITSFKNSSRFGHGSHASIFDGQIPGVDLLKGASNNPGSSSEADLFFRVYHFRYPYTELLQWALLSRRYDLARYMVLSGEESIAKALISVKILRGVRKAVDADSEIEFSKELKEWEGKFEKLAVELQAHCYRHDAEQAKRLLTYELKTFSKNTCLSLAYLCESKLFLAHPCTQSILNDLWYGGLREGQFVGLKVGMILFGLALPPMYPILAYFFTKHSKLLEFKTKEELAKQPQTLEEYLEEKYDSSSDSSSSSSSGRSSRKNSENDLKSSDSGHIFSKRHSETSRARQKTRSESTDRIGSDDANSIDHNQDEQDGIRKSYFKKFKRKSSLLFYSKKLMDRKQNHSLDETGETEMKTFEKTPGKEKDPHPLPSLEKPNKDETDPVKHGQTTNPQAIRSNLAVLLPNNKHYSSVASTEVSNHSKTSNNIPEEMRTTKRKTCIVVDQNVPNLTSLAETRTKDFTNPAHLLIDELCLNRMYSSTYQSPKKHLSFQKKIYEFFSAPVTRFYLHVHLYVLFLILYIGLCIYTVPRDSFSWLEFYVYLHIITYFLDKFREITLNPGNFYLQKFRVHMESFWNIYDLMMCLFSVAGIFVRYLGLVFPECYMWGKNWLILCCALWQMRFLELMQIWRFSGPYIYMLVKMLRVMVPMLSLLFFPLVAFGTIRQGIMYNNATQIDLKAIKGVLLKPYFMMYGEVYASEIDPDDWNIDLDTAPLNEAVPIAMVIYLLYSIILLLSVLIATFNDVFTSVLAQAELVYKYLRYAVIIEYESRPLLPPPFIIISWIYSATKIVFKNRKKGCSYRTIFLQNFCCCFVTLWKNQRNEGASGCLINNVEEINEKRKTSRSQSDLKNKAALNNILDRNNHRDNDSGGLKLFLDQDEVEKLHDFEEECVEDYWRETKIIEKKASDNHLDKINSKLDQLQFSINEFHLRQTQLRGAVCLLEEEMANVADNTFTQLSQLHSATNKIYSTLQRSERRMTSSPFLQMSNSIWNSYGTQFSQQLSIDEAKNFISKKDSDVTMQPRSFSEKMPINSETDNKLIMTTLLTLLRKHFAASDETRKTDAGYDSKYSTKNDINGYDSLQPSATENLYTSRILDSSKDMPAINLQTSSTISKSCINIKEKSEPSQMVYNSPIKKVGSCLWPKKTNFEEFIHQEKLERDESSEKDVTENVLKLLYKRIETEIAEHQNKSSPKSEGRQVESQSVHSHISHIAPQSSFSTSNKNKNRLLTAGFRQRLANLSSRLADATSREYTTICDDIDLSCLNQPDSPETSPLGSNMDLTSIDINRRINSPEGQNSRNRKKYRSQESNDEKLRLSDVSLNEGLMPEKNIYLHDVIGRPKEDLNLDQQQAIKNVNLQHNQSTHLTTIMRKPSTTYDPKSVSYSSFSKDDELMKAEAMERAELKGVLLKRLRQLSFASSTIPVPPNFSMYIPHKTLNVSQEGQARSTDEFDTEAKIGDNNDEDFKVYDNKRKSQMMDITDQEMSAYLSGHNEGIDDEDVNMELDIDATPPNTNRELHSNYENVDSIHEVVSAVHSSSWKSMAKMNFRSHKRTDH